MIKREEFLLRVGIAASEQTSRDNLTLFRLVLVRCGASEGYLGGEGRGGEGRGVVKAADVNVNSFFTKDAQALGVLCFVHHINCSWCCYGPLFL